MANQRWEQAEGEFDRALALRPGDAEVLVETGHALIMVGRSQEGRLSEGKKSEYACYRG